MFRNVRLLGPAAMAACVLIGWSGIGTAGAQSACADLGGTVDPDQICHVHNATAGYTLDSSFPVDYPDQQPLTDFLKQQRDGFVNWVAQYGPPGRRDRPYEDVVTGTTYRSGPPATGTQSLVFEIQDDTGLAHEDHPDTRFNAFNYDLPKHAPITFDTLFKPGTQPLQVIYPAVQREVEKHRAVLAPIFNDLGEKAYQNFAITDDAVIFFFGENQLMQDNNGPHQVSVPRTELASLMA
jgi:hypothetical protein